MIAALKLEVAAVRKQGGATQIDLRDGERLSEAEGSWLYRFLVPDLIHLRDDTPVRVVLDKSDVSGTLVSFREGVLIVALDENCGARIEFARLVADASFLLEQLYKKFEKVQSGEADFKTESAERVLGLSDSIVSEESDPAPQVFVGEELNSKQRLAVKRSLGSNTTFIWGPPGTGKTTTLARIAEAHYRAGHSVLLVSNTNVAVDTALEKIVERLEEEPDFSLGLVIRKGPIVKESLQENFEDRVSLGKIVARLGEKLTVEKSNLQGEIPVLKNKASSLVKMLKNFENLQNARDALDSKNLEISSTLELAQREKLRAGDIRAHLRALHVDLKKANSYGLIRRVLSGLYPEDIQRKIVEVADDEQRANDAAQKHASAVPEFEAQVPPLQAEIERLKEVTEKCPPHDKMVSELEQTRIRLATIQERVDDITRELKDLEKQVLARCRILATTVYRTYLGKEGLRHFDAVIIDEASMLMAPLAYYAAGLAEHSVTVAGDFRQLAPIVMSKERRCEDWLKCDVFEKSKIPDSVEKGEDLPHLVALQEQYRMREEICSVVNDLFYKGELETTRTDVEQDDGFPHGSEPLYYVNTASFQPWAALRVGGFSRYNLFHALLARNIVSNLAEQGYLRDAGKNSGNSVGLVSPYGAQAQLIQRLIEDKLDEKQSAGIAATVHRFQGNEKDAMIVELTDSTGAWLGRFMKATVDGEDGARLLNVAISRARNHVILIANFDFLRAKAPGGAFVQKLLTRFQEHGTALDVEKLLPLTAHDWVDGLRKIFPADFKLPEKASGIFDEGSFYPAFQKDLIRAKKSIVIFSPFSTLAGTSRWVDIFRSGLQRGVEVRILTKPIKEWGGGSQEEKSELVQRLRNLGVVVDFRARMHEKIAIIDERTLWHGSLNILSHNDTHESMLRFDSPGVCEQLARFVTPSGGRREVPSLVVSSNPKCSKCASPMVWNDGRYGIWYTCEKESCDGKSQKK